MENLKNLLSQVAIINKKNAEILDASGARFNMFRVCGVDHYEETHSKILAEFLNPQGSHGLRAKLLEAFIETIDTKFALQGFNYQKASVKTEHPTGDGRIDILIEDDKHKAIIIENKIYAGDQPQQLSRYDKYAFQTYGEGNYEIVYLTLDGHEASLQSITGEKRTALYNRISYAEDVIGWLEKCLSFATRFPLVRETIVQYINHLKQLTNQDMDTTNEQEVTELLSKVENLRAAKAIFQNYPGVFDSLAKEQFNPDMEEFAKGVGLKYKLEHAQEEYIKFVLKKDGWKEDYWIEFNHGRFGFVQNFGKGVKFPSEQADHLRKKMHNYHGGQDDWWVFRSDVRSLNIDDWETDIINSDKFFEDCKRKIVDLLEALQSINFDED